MALPPSARAPRCGEEDWHVGLRAGYHVGAPGNGPKLCRMPLHVRITSKSPLRRHADALALDKDEVWLEENILAPRREGRDIFVDGQVFSWDGIDAIRINETERTSDELLTEIRARRASERAIAVGIPDRWYVTKQGDDVTEKYISGPPGTERPRGSGSAPTAKDAAAVMVIHGRDTEARDAMFGWLRAIGLSPREWSVLVQATGSASPYIGEVLDRAFADAQAVVALLTPDEHVLLREVLGSESADWRLQSRPNVLFEAGMAFAAQAKRTVIVVLGDQSLPSDLDGRNYVRLDGTAKPLGEIATRLETAGCPVDRSGTEWLDPARFPVRDRLLAHPLMIPSPEDPSSHWRPAFQVHGELILFELHPLNDEALASHSCLVTEPGGAVSHAEDLTPMRLSPGGSLWFSYPDPHFTGAPPPTSGRYEVVWRDPLSADAVELSRAAHDIEVPGFRIQLEPQGAISPGPIRLVVVNDDMERQFDARVRSMEGDDRVEAPDWFIRWRGHPEERRVIRRGDSHRLDLVELLPPEHPLRSPAPSPVLRFFTPQDGHVDVGFRLDRPVEDGGLQDAAVQLVIEVRPDSGPSLEKTLSVAYRVGGWLEASFL